MSSLLSNRTNLFPTILDFVRSSKNFTLYSAFIKQDLLKEIIQESDGRIKQIVVRFEPEDIINDASDIEIFELCKEKKIVLYRNPKLHAKCLVNEKGDCILGSANYTNKGMQKSIDSNWEINTKVKQVDFDSMILLKRILLESELVTQNYVDQLHDMLNGVVSDTPIIEFPGTSDQFLISSLPMCHHPEVIWEIIHESKIVPFEELNAASHDIALYQMFDAYESKKEFLNALEQKVNQHPFILMLLGYIRENGTCNYGMIVRWIQNNCTQVPIPRSWELKKELVVNILYEWICFFNDDFRQIRKYPNGSDIISYKNLNH